MSIIIKEGFMGKNELSIEVVAMKILVIRGKRDLAGFMELKLLH